MPETISYYSFALSPFTYFGHDLLRSIADRHGAAIRYKPMKLFDVWGNSGAVPPAKRPPVRQRYRLTELARISLGRKIDINLKPAHWPTDPTLADNVTIALQEAGENPHDFMTAVLRSVWSDDKNIAEESLISELLGEAGFDAPKFIELARQDDIEAIRTRNSEEAIADDVIGAPAYVYKGEVFWGQDRLEMLDAMIESGRDPFIFSIE